MGKELQKKGRKIKKNPRQNYMAEKYTPKKEKEREKYKKRMKN